VAHLDDVIMKSPRVLSDGEWARIEPLLPSSAGRRGHPFRDHRQVVEGMVYRLRWGVSWRELPVEFGPWQTVWKRHRRFCTDGTLTQILACLQAEADLVAQLARPASRPQDPAAAQAERRRAVGAATVH
jgi:transposase